MIKELFFPEKIGDYYVFSKTIVGVEIHKNHVSSTQLQVSGRSIFISQCNDIHIDTAIEKEKNDLISKTLQTHLLKNTQVKCALSASLAIFKHLHVPFSARQKIEDIVPYEVAPLLPFTLEQAVIDFIITKTYETGQADILVVAVQKHHIARYNEYFEAAQLNLKNLTVDLIALYGLYQEIPSYKSIKGHVAILDIGLNSTHVMYIVDGQLRLVRSLQYGLISIALTLSEKLSLTQQQAMDNIIRYGFEKKDWTEYERAINESADPLWRNIQFTLQSSTQNIRDNQSLQKIFILGQIAQIQNILAYASHTLEVPCEFFNATLITEKEHTSSKLSPIPIQNVVSTATAYPSSITEGFNLLKDEFRTERQATFMTYIVTFGILITLFLTILLGSYIWNTRVLSRELYSSEQEIIATLQESIPGLDEDAQDIEDVLQQAQTQIKKEEEKWFAFSNQARASFLQYLLELTNRIDKQALDFKPDRISITNGTMTLQAKVKDYDALKKFEKTLRESKLFSRVEGQNDPNFTMRISLKPVGGKK